jgi:kinesin family protein 5
MSVSNIKVVCRFRPENKLEEANNSHNIITVNEDNTSLNIDVN